jgi:hypothetical protein
VQNAADAGVLAGARIVARSDPSAPLSAQAEVESVVNADAMKLGGIDSIACTYVDDHGSELGTCASTVPDGATGVKVAVIEEHPTFFIHVVPGTPESVETGADAVAHVKRLAAATDGPFLPCAVKAQLATTNGTVDILIKQNGSWVINPAAVGQTFQIHGSQVETCNAKSSRFKGFADTDANRNRTAPGWFKYEEGVKAGHIAADVEGPDGCKAGQEVENCVVFLPIIANNPAESGNNREVWAVAFAPFYVTAPKKMSTTASCSPAT